MRVLLCPDKFKGSLSAPEVANALEEGLLAANPQLQIDKAPMADGGDGTVDAFLAAAGGKKVPVEITGPLGERVQSFYGVLADGTTCVIEMAAASGLAMVPEAKRNPMHTTSAGTGELLQAALTAGYRKIIIGIGGSATNDGGMGFLDALGMRFFDEGGKRLATTGRDMLRAADVGMADMHPAIKEAQIQVACDVNNPLCGENGASAIFGPQKGADAEMIKELDAGLGRFEKIVSKALGKPYALEPGSGAAGGIGGALLAIGADLKMGTEIVIESIGLKQRSREANIMITGEGATDASTLFGKVPVAMGALAGEAGIPCICISGSLLEGYKPVYEKGVSAVFSIINRPMDLDSAMAQAYELVAEMAENVARLIFD